MMERLHTREKIEALPKRAKARLKTMYELGIVPYDLVLYHEIKPARRPSALATWASQDLPVIAEKAGEQVVRHGPGILKAIALVTWQMLVLFGFMLLILVMAIARDPVLVVVTEDGYWIEVDRWYS